MPSSFGGALPKNPRRRVNQAMRWLQNLHGTMSSSKKGRPSSPNTPLQPQISACEKCGLAQHAAEGGVLGRGKIMESLQGRHNSHTLPGSQLFCKARSAPLLPALQFVEHGFHLREGVLITCTTRAFDDLLQQRMLFLLALRASESLRCHEVSIGCLLYTSDAADEEDSVDLGGRR